MMDESTALRKLLRLHKGQDNRADDVFKEIGVWARSAQEAIARGDIQAAKAFIAVVMDMCGVSL